MTLAGMCSPGWAAPALATLLSFLTEPRGVDRPYLRCHRFCWGTAGSAMGSLLSKELSQEKAQGVALHKPACCAQKGAALCLTVCCWGSQERVLCSYLLPTLPQASVSLSVMRNGPLLWEPEGGSVRPKQSKDALWQSRLTSCVIHSVSRW